MRPPPQPARAQLIISGVESVAANYEFTTLTTVPGQITHNGAKIQILDLPGIIAGAKASPCFQFRATALTSRTEKEEVDKL
jgi:ribosome-interacting GTPase 1